jgi:hypothetical protein
MSAQQEFKYEVFISYSRKDAGWAQKLYDDLLARRVLKANQIFFDRQRLQAGDKWEMGLLDALVNSRHIIILWSNHARESDWVIQEKSYFIADVNLKAATQSQAGRRPIFVSLEGQDQATKSYQWVMNLDQAGDYPRGAANVNPDVWRQAVDKIAQAIDPKQFIQIPLAVLAMTEDRIPSYDFDQTLLSGERLGDVLKKIGIEKKEDLTPYYGPTPLDWRPFGISPNRNNNQPPANSVSILSLMERVQDSVNQELADNQLDNKLFRWRIVNDFWSGTPEARANRSELSQSQSVIVIDAVSLFDLYITRRYTNLYDSFNNKDALIIACTPFALPDPIDGFRILIENGATQVFQYFFEPRIVATHPYARCGADVGHEKDVSRWLRNTLRMEPPSGAGGNAFTKP